MAGIDVELERPVYVAARPRPVRLRPAGYLRADVERQLRDVLSARVLPDGQPGFFHPDRFTFGQPLRLSDVVAAAMAVAGVASVELERFAPVGAPDDRRRAANLAAGQIADRAARGAALRQRPQQPGGRPASTSRWEVARDDPPVPRTVPGQPQLRGGCDRASGQRALARMRAGCGWPARGTRSRCAAWPRHGSDDPAIALLDAWAVVADVVSFYTERIATEGFLRTATERGSVRELARTLGYELRPGVAAAGRPRVRRPRPRPARRPTSSSPAGTPVQSVPGAGQLPQTFETAADLEVRGGVEQPAACTGPPAQTVTTGAQSIWLQGTQFRLKPGDRLLSWATPDGSPAVRQRYATVVQAVVTARRRP